MLLKRRYVESKRKYILRRRIHVRAEEENMYKQKRHARNRRAPRPSLLVRAQRDALPYQREEVADPADLQSTYAPDFVERQRVEAVPAERECDPAGADEELPRGVEAEGAVEFGAVV